VDLLDYERIKSYCRKNDFRLPVQWKNRYNAVKKHSGHETPKHFLYKAVLAYELMEQGQTVFTELEFDYSNRASQKRMSFPTCDLLWLDEKIVVEFESKPKKSITELKQAQFSEFNVFVFDIEKYSIKDIMVRIGLKDSKDKVPVLDFLNAGCFCPR